MPKDPLEVRVASTQRSRLWRSSRKSALLTSESGTLKMLPKTLMYILYMRAHKIYEVLAESREEYAHVQS